MLPVYIETPRLIIRPFEMTDDKDMFEMDSDPVVHRYVGGKPVHTIDEIRKVIAYVQQQYIDNGIGRWAVIAKESGRFIGWAGFKMLEGPVNGHSNFIDFGYRFARAYWQQGYGKEAAKATFDFGIRYLGYKEMFAMTDVDNIASRRILEGLGFECREIFEYDANPDWRVAGQPTTWYRWRIS